MKFIISLIILFSFNSTLLADIETPKTTNEENGQSFDFEQLWDSRYNYLHIPLKQTLVQLCNGKFEHFNKIIVNSGKLTFNDSISTYLNRCNSSISSFQKYSTFKYVYTLKSSVPLAFALTENTVIVSTGLVASALNMDQIIYHILTAKIRDIEKFKCNYSFVAKNENRVIQTLLKAYKNISLKDREFIDKKAIEWVKSLGKSTDFLSVDFENQQNWEKGFHNLSVSNSFFQTQKYSYPDWYYNKFRNYISNKLLERTKVDTTWKTRLKNCGIELASPNTIADLDFNNIQNQCRRIDIESDLENKNIIRALYNLAYFKHKNASWNADLAYLHCYAYLELVELGLKHYTSNIGLNAIKNTRNIDYEQFCSILKSQSTLAKWTVLFRLTRENMHQFPSDTRFNYLLRKTQEIKSLTPLISNTNFQQIDWNTYSKLKSMVPKTDTTFKLDSMSYELFVVPDLDSIVQNINKEHLQQQTVITHFNFVLNRTLSDEQMKEELNKVQLFGKNPTKRVYSIRNNLEQEILLKDMFQSAYQENFIQSETNSKVVPINISSYQQLIDSTTNTMCLVQVASESVSRKEIFRKALFIVTIPFIFPEYYLKRNKTRYNMEFIDMRTGQIICVGTKIEYAKFNGDHCNYILNSFPIN